MKKRLLSLLLALTLLLPASSLSAAALELIVTLPPITLPDTTWDGTSDTAWSGAGTKASPYLITTAQELAGLSALVNAGTHYKGTYFKLTADVRLNKDTLRQWTPIGGKNRPFRGIFDGNGHTVSGLYIDAPSGGYLGLFGALGTGGTVINLGLIGGLIHGTERVALIVGSNSGLIQNCYSSGEVYAKGDYVGGVAGLNQGAIVDCYNTGVITGIGSSDNFIGGIAGYNDSGVITGCYNAGVVTGRFRIGGIAGRNGGSSVIFNCWNIGDVTSTMHETGGIVGHNGPQCIVANCYNTGDIKGTHRIGGITGYNYAGVTINSYNIGYITGRSGESGIGAIVGYNDDRAVSGTGFMGGYDVADKTGYVVGCYWLAGCIDAGRKSGVGANDDNCSIIGVGKFTSPTSSIIATDTNRGGSSWLSETIEFAVGKAIEVGIDIACEELEIDVPESLKDIEINIDSQAAFPGNATVYTGTLLEVLNLGVGAETSDNYGMWYQYADANSGYPVLIQKSSLIFIPIITQLRPIALNIITPIVDEIEAAGEVEEVADAAAFTLSDRYPADQTVQAGGSAGFSTSLAQGSANPGNLFREWHVVIGDVDCYISENTGIGDCSFELVNDNYLLVTVAADAVSAVHRVYCIVSNESGTFTSRMATLTINGTVPPADPGTETPYTFPFADVPEGAWYRGDVENAHKSGLINGTTATAYSPDSLMTRAEVIKLAACMHQLHRDGAVTLTNGSPYWYSSYVTYALDNGIIGSAYADYNVKVTREEFVTIFYNALPATEYGDINSVADGAIPDVTMGTSHAGEIYAFYRAGILVGSDAAGTFNPLTNIKRSEVAAILTRMFDAAARKSITLT